MSVEIPPAKLITHLTHTHIVPGRLKITELFFSVPLNYAKPDGRQIRLFCSAAERLETPAAGKSSAEQKPWLVYLTGGPGFGNAPPQDMNITGPIVDRGYKLLCFDHRGMGLSTPVTARSILAQGDVSAQAAYLKEFRADNAVRDLEAIRICLTASYPKDEKKWSVWGQSYGGFVALTYLSFRPHGLKEVFTTGGLAPISQKYPDQVYKRLFQKVEERNAKYYTKCPEDRERVKNILSYLGRGDIRLPSGGILTTRRFLSIGIIFGAHGGLDNVHNLVLRMQNDLDTVGYLIKPTLIKIESWGAFDEQPLYCLLHEAIYCSGRASKWSAERVLMELAQFQIASPREEFLFTGEMVFPSDLECHAELQAVAQVAQEIASFPDWPDLYAIERLKENEVPVYSITYVDDMYVDFEFAQETAGLLKNCKVHITNTLYHNAVRSKAGEVVDILFKLRDDSID